MLRAQQGEANRLNGPPRREGSRRAADPIFLPPSTGGGVP